MRKKANLSMKHIVLLVIWLIISYFSIHLGHGLQQASNYGYEGLDMITRGFSFFALNAEVNPLAPFSTLFSLESLTPLFLLFGSIVVLGIATAFFGKRSNFRYKEEHDSAEFSKEGDYNAVKEVEKNVTLLGKQISKLTSYLDVKKEEKKYKKWKKRRAAKQIYKDPNIILTSKVKLSLNHRKTRKNLNVIVIGGPGTGKTRFFGKPNLCNLSSSYIVTDPKGEVLKSTGKMLKKAGYKIKVLNLVDMQESNMYNPFVYLRKDREEDVLSLITAIVQNTGGGDKKKGGDPFWESAEMLFLQAIFFYILHVEEPERQNMDTVMEMLRMADFTKEKNPLDELFFRLEEKEPNHVAVTNYKLLKASATETLRSIVIMANSRFAPFSVPSVSKLFKEDTFEMDKLDDRKTATFVIISPSNTTFNFIAAMFYTQFFSQLDYIANWVNPQRKNIGQRLEIPMLMILDEFANVGKIPNFEKIIAYARSLNVGIFIIVQSLLQLKDMYGDAWEGLWDSSDTKLFLGGQSQYTLEYMSKQIGKQTIDNRTRSQSFGRQRSSSQNEAILGRDLMTPDEIALLDDNECLLFMRSYRVLKTTKYDVKSHPNYYELSEDKGFYRHKVKHKAEEKKFEIRIGVGIIIPHYEQYGTVDKKIADKKIVDKEEKGETKGAESSTNNEDTKPGGNQGTGGGNKPLETIYKRTSIEELLYNKRKSIINSLEKQGVTFPNRGGFY